LILSFATTAELGTVEAIGAVGALLGGILLSVWGGPRRRVWGIGGFMLLQGLILCLGGLQASVWLIATACFLFMFTAPVVGGCNQTIWQSKVALDLQGRVFAMREMVASASMPIAYLASGFLADRVFEPLLLPGGALAGTVGRVIGIGKGRGVGLLFILLGTFMVVAVLLSFLSPRLRRVETELPNAGLGRGAS
jgi:DHA3 family macrolide efflux protein-like MFS transporter